MHDNSGVVASDERKEPLKNREKKTLVGLLCEVVCASEDESKGLWTELKMVK